MEIDLDKCEFDLDSCTLGGQMKGEMYTLNSSDVQRDLGDQWIAP